MDFKTRKLVFLTSRFPYPLNKGDKLRVFNQLKFLSKEFEVHLICINDKKIPQDGLDVVSSICHSIHYFILPKYKRIFSLVASLWKGIPFQVAFFYNKKIDEKINNLIAKIKPDYIHCHLIRTTEYIKFLDHRAISLDFMDAFSHGMEKRELIELNPLKKLLYRYEKERLRKYESTSLHYAESYCIISEQDSQTIYNPLSKKIDVVANGVDFDQFYPREVSKKYDLLFMGNMSYPPNILAVSFLVEKIMPLIHKNRPTTSLLIAGIGATKKIKNYQNKDIHVIERFEDISDSIAFSRIMVAPMLISIGLQNKIIQAMAMNVPCIVSPLSNKPIGGKHGLNIIEAETPKQYSTAILDLLNNHNKREQIAQNGFKFVKSKFSWSKQNQYLKEMIES